MTEKPYSKREIDAMNETTEGKYDDLKEFIVDGFKGIHARQDYANGRVNKIILALMLAFGLILGLGATNFSSVIRLIF